MQLGRIVLKIRAAGTSLGANVLGAADLNAVMTNTFTPKMPIAFVIPVSEDAKENEYHPAVNQIVYERFGVIVAIPTDGTQKDKTGLLAYDQLHDMRAELFRPLVGWDMGFSEAIYYRGGKLIGIDRAVLWYQFDFEYKSRIVSNPDGFGEIETTTIDDRAPVSSLPDFDRIWAQYILTPSVKWEDLMNDPSMDLPETLVPADMTQFIDLTDDPDAGPYGSGFARAFDFFIRK